MKKISLKMAIVGVIRLILLLILITLPISSNAQNLFVNPESVVFDSLNNRYLVSCANPGQGNIVQIDSAGKQSYFTHDLNFSCGLHIVGNTIYVARCDQGGLVGYDLTTAERVMNLGCYF